MSLCDFFQRLSTVVMCDLPYTFRMRNQVQDWFSQAPVCPFQFFTKSLNCSLHSGRQQLIICGKPYSNNLKTFTLCPSFIFTVIYITYSHLRRRIILYIEYQSICHFLRIGSPRPLSPKRVCPPRNQRGGGEATLACG